MRKVSKSFWRRQRQKTKKVPDRYQNLSKEEKEKKIEYIKHIRLGPQNMQKRVFPPKNEQVCHTYSDYSEPGSRKVWLQLQKHFKICIINYTDKCILDEIPITYNSCHAVAINYHLD